MQNRTSLPWKELGENFKIIYINQHKNSEAAQKAWMALSTDEQRATLNSVVENKEEQKTYPQKTSSSTETTSNTKKIEDDVKMPGNLVKLCLEYSGIFAKLSEGEIDAIQTIDNKVKLNELCTAILSGNRDTAEKMIKEDPSLLLAKLECITAPLSGHKAKGTAYQLALAVEDTQMAEMIKSYFTDKNQADHQFDEQFPTGWEKEEETTWAPIFAQLEKVTQAISANQGNIISSGYPEYKLTVTEGTAVAIALTEFQSLMDALLNEVVTTGRHFNPNLLLSAFKTYDDHFADFFGNDWSNPRAMLFWQRVIGYIQRFLPTNYVQAFIDGLYNTEAKLQKGTPQGRALKFELYDAGKNAWVFGDFYPLSGSRLGLDFALYAQAIGVGRGHALPGTRRAGLSFRGLCQSKTAGLQNLRHNTERADLSRQNRLGLV